MPPMLQCSSLGCVSSRVERGFQSRALVSVRISLSAALYRPAPPSGLCPDYSRLPLPLRVSRQQLLPILSAVLCLGCTGASHRRHAAQLLAADYIRNRCPAAGCFPCCCRRADSGRCGNEGYLGGQPRRKFFHRQCQAMPLVGASLTMSSRCFRLPSSFSSVRDISCFVYPAMLT